MDDGWEQRMSERAVARETEKWDRAAQELAAEQQRTIEEHPDEVSRFKGTCDVCGESISLVWHYSFGIIDYGIAEDGFPYTWITHPEGTDPNCRLYSSRVDYVRMLTPGFYDG